MVLNLAVTRTSEKWRSKPGNFDRVNARAIFPSTNELGIPDLPQATLIPDGLVGYNDRYQLSHAHPGDAVHFFLDDYRFETMWSQPERSLSRVQQIKAALTPDFSLWTQMPLAMQQWQVYRSRWCGAWMAHHGIAVIPTISWSTPKSWDFAFLGIPTGSVVAISTVGVGQEAMPFFKRGLQAMIYQIEPSWILVHGRMLPALEGLNVTQYPHKWRL